eukprot:TRINITY_DN110109_c0_g1_i1.p3 TRINITY_DN110109_c0_g1~~TRINITY_DN110109_c0_g1_i1.p3  ORF type:complete len:120 (-),score=20.90 TRINITY_DN110109_c0_g1_i1:137-496(-)
MRKQKLLLDGTCLCVGKCRCLDQRYRPDSADKRGWCGMQGCLLSSGIGSGPSTWIVLPLPTKAAGTVSSWLFPPWGKEVSPRAADEDAGGSWYFFNQVYWLIEWMSELLKPKLTDGSPH